MDNVGLQEVENYVLCRQNTVAQFIATRPIMDLSMVAERRLGSRVPTWWLGQEGQELVGMQTEDWEAE